MSLQDRIARVSLCAALLVTACAPAAQTPEIERPAASAPDAEAPEDVRNEVVAPTADERLQQLEERAASLRQQHGDDGFTFVVEPPFVVGGDEDADTVRGRAEGTVGWAVRMLNESYFERDPKHVIVVWLFKDKTSYRKHCRAFWNEDPHTPYGYYSPSDRVLVMNIASGSGTLVHEIVHPFMESNFAACPSWFNEGLASLYEQSYSRDGKIMGATNWRLRGLQGAIRADRVPSFKELCGTTTREFYNEDPGTNYSQARYLCYYLQEKKLLRKYYHQFVKDSKKDPTGYKTLMSILKTEDMDQFKKDWQKYVTRLRY